MIHKPIWIYCSALWLRECPFSWIILIMMDQSLIQLIIPECSCFLVLDGKLKHVLSPIHVWILHYDDNPVTIILSTVIWVIHYSHLTLYSDGANYWNICWDITDRELDEYGIKITTIWWNFSLCGLGSVVNIGKY